MIDIGLADQRNRLTGEQTRTSRATVLRWFAAIVAVSFVLRIAYAGHLYEDEGLWFTAAEEILRGKALYSEIYFDKPPGLALVYAVLFWIFEAHILTVRLFTIAYSVAISAVLFLFGRWLYNSTVGLLAAAMFAVFSTTYATGHMQGMSTEFLMALPYTAGAYLLVRSRWESRRQALLALTGGILSGLAFQINPKGGFNLIFFAVFLIAARRWPAATTSIDSVPADGERETPAPKSQSALRLFAPATIGFVAASLPFLALIAVTRSFPFYWSYVWDWGARYSSYYGAGRIVESALVRSADFFALNNALLITLLFFIWTALRGYAVAKNNIAAAVNQASEASLRARAGFRPDIILLMWFAVSYLAVMVGGRFFAHYFFQILPGLCLIGAGGLTMIIASLRARSRAFRRTVISIIAIGFALTLVRFHARSVLLAADYVRGTTSSSTASWYYEQRNREERVVASAVKEKYDRSEAADRSHPEAVRAGGPRERAAEGPADYLFVWGYRPEIYFWSGLLPASRFLSTQPLTGVPADVHYFGDDYRPVLEEAVTARARRELVRELEVTQPKYIVDEIGFFNNDLGILQYPELRELMSLYKPLGTTERFFIYLRKDFSRKYRQRH